MYVMAGRLHINRRQGSRHLGVHIFFAPFSVFETGSCCIDQAHRDLPLALSAGIKGVCTENAHIVNHKHKAERANWKGSEA